MYVAEDEIEESDLSDLEDWMGQGAVDRDSGEGPSSEVESGDWEEEERVVLGKRTKRPHAHVEIEYETERESRTKLRV